MLLSLKAHPPTAERSQCTRSGITVEITISGFLNFLNVHHTTSHIPSQRSRQKEHTFGDGHNTTKEQAPEPAGYLSA